MKRLALFVTTVFCFATLCQGKPAETGAAPGEWTMDFDAARKVAAEKNLPIFINFTGSDWCVWCKHMEKEVFSKSEWTDYAKGSLMLVWIDFPKDKSLVPEKYRKRNKQLSETFDIKGYPAYIILDQDGKTQLGELEASQQIDPKTFIGKVKTVLAESDAAMQKLTAGMPAKEAETLKAAIAERKKSRAELIELQKKEQALSSSLFALEGKIDAMRTKALADKLSPAQAALYLNAKKDLTATKKELQDWIAGKPKQTPENREKYQEMNRKISGIKSKISDLLYSE